MMPEIRRETFHPTPDRDPHGYIARSLAIGAVLGLIILGLMGIGGLITYGVLVSLGRVL